MERGRLVDRLNGLVVAKHGAIANNNKNSRNKGSKKNNEDEDEEELLYYYHGKTVTMNKAQGSEMAGYVSNTSHIRAALLVLIQHALVKVSSGGGAAWGSSKQKQKHYTYTFLADKAKLLPRYPRYVEHAQTTFNDIAGDIVECLLYNGRMCSEDIISSVWEDVKKKKLQLDEGDTDMNGDSEESDSALQEIVQSFVKLVEGGYVTIVSPIVTNRELDDIQKGEETKKDDGIHGGEVEFNLDDDGIIVAEQKNKKGGKKRKQTPARASARGKRASKKQKTANGSNAKDESALAEPTHHPQITSLFSSHRKLISQGSVYRVNVSMMHASLRTAALSRLVSEMYPNEGGAKQNGGESNKNMKHVGTIIHAALTFAMRQEHAPILGMNESEEERHIRITECGIFCPADILPYLPDEVISSLKSQVGGLNSNLSTLLVQMSRLQYPPILTEVEDALGHPKGGKFEISTKQLLTKLRSRIQHRIISTHHGLVAARAVSILQMKGHCESDVIAEDAMVPAKEAREMLHRLHRDKYINLFDMHQTKTHNTGTAIFLWNVVPSRLYKTVINNICTALLNLRLRRQHEVEVGKDWMDRAKEAGATEENESEEDKKKYTAFCKGLERLDCACLQLDETLMILKDF